MKGILNRKRKKQKSNNNRKKMKKFKTKHNKDLFKKENELFSKVYFN